MGQKRPKQGDGGDHDGVGNGGDGGGNGGDGGGKGGDDGGNGGDSGCKSSTEHYSSSSCLTFIKHLEIDKSSSRNEQISYTKKIVRTNERTINHLDEVKFVFSDELCFKSYKGLPENDERNAWLEKASDTIKYEHELFQYVSDVNDNLPAKQKLRNDPILRNVTPTIPSGPLLVKEYSAASSFAIERLRFSATEQDIVACSFPKFTTEESHHIWRQALRRRVLDSACAPHRGAVASDWILSNCLYWNLENHLGYCALFKVGSTSWMSHMLRWFGIQTDNLSDEKVHELMDDVFHRPPLHRVANKLRSKQLLLFMVHRHPFVRIASAYTNKIQAGYRPRSRLFWIALVRGKSLYEIMQEVRYKIKNKFSWLGKNQAFDELLAVRGDPHTSPDFQVVGDRNDESPEMTFREFVRVVIAQILPCFDDVHCLRDVDEHWQPQHTQCSSCTAYYDVIAAMHTFNQDTSLIMKLVGRSDYYGHLSHDLPDQFRCVNNCSYDTTPKPKGRRNVSLGGTYVEKTFEYLEQLSAEEKRLLFVTNFLDFSLFGYSPDAIEYSK
ncbi:Sulfotransferase [Trinorchestia longiramus]|nr:Sulfotransferase [Trinorchestia longiramus]